MATCRYCGKSSIFLSVSESGLCKQCAPGVTMELQSRLRIVNDSVELIERSKNLDTKLSRIALLLEHLDHLSEFERRGILQYKATAAAKQYRAIRSQIILEGFRQEAASAISKAELATTLRSKISALSKPLIRISELRTRGESLDGVDEIENDLNARIHKATLDDHLEEARKAEFKGQTKKAIDRYQEALYFLRHDKIDDKSQHKQIVAIEAKLAELTNRDEG